MLLGWAMGDFAIANLQVKMQLLGKVPVPWWAQDALQQFLQPTQGEVRQAWPGSRQERQRQRSL